MRFSALLLPRAPPNLRFAPFVSANLDDYLRRYWAVVFTVGARPIETGHMRHYVGWYCTRLKVVELDHHLHAQRLRAAVAARAGTPDLPVLFVNQKVIGTIADVKELERRRLLKDAVQFGFQWKTGAGTDGAPLRLGALPSAHGDTELFRARYRGTPVARPVVQLPALHPHHKFRDEE